jgi:hypothetical protein
MFAMLIMDINKVFISLWSLVVVLCIQRWIRYFASCFVRSCSARDRRHQLGLRGKNEKGNQPRIYRSSPPEISWSSICEEIFRFQIDEDRGASETLSTSGIDSSQNRNFPLPEKSHIVCLLSQISERHDRDTCSLLGWIEKEKAQGRQTLISSRFFCFWTRRSRQAGGAPQLPHPTWNPVAVALFLFRLRLGAPPPHVGGVWAGTARVALKCFPATAHMLLSLASPVRSLGGGEDGDRRGPREAKPVASVTRGGGV